MPPPLRQREGRSAQNKAALTSAGDDEMAAMVVSISVTVVLNIVTVGMQYAH